MEKIINKIAQFRGKYNWLSNFYPINDKFFEGRTLEHHYQAAKTSSDKEKQKILKAFTPGEAKQLGQKVILIDDWDTIRINVMRELLRRKFKNKELRGKLLKTGDMILEEGNNHGDSFWGIFPPDSGNGTNMLGIMLMELREEMKNA